MGRANHYAPLFSVVVVSAPHLVRTSHPSGSRSREGMPSRGLPPSPWPYLAPENRRCHTASMEGDHRSTGSRMGPTPSWLTASVWRENAQKEGTPGGVGGRMPGAPLPSRPAGGAGGCGRG